MVLHQKFAQHWGAHIVHIVSHGPRYDVWEKLVLLEDIYVYNMCYNGWIQKNPAVRKSYS